MSGIYNGRSIDQFREEQRKAAVERHQTRQRLEAEQQERIQQEKEGACRPQLEEMQATAEALTRKVAEIQPGSPRAVAEMRTYLLQTLRVVSYTLEVATKSVDKREKTK